MSHKNLDGGLDAQALRFEGNIGGRTVGVHGIITRLAAADRVGICIEKPRSGQPTSVQALVVGAAVFSGELAGLLRPALDLSGLKITPRYG